MRPRGSGGGGVAMVVMVVVVVVVGLFGPWWQGVVAKDNHLFNSNIPASECRPITDYQDSVLTLVTAASIAKFQVTKPPPLVVYLSSLQLVAQKAAQGWTANLLHNGSTLDDVHWESLSIPQYTTIMDDEQRIRVGVYSSASMLCMTTDRASGVIMMNISRLCTTEGSSCESWQIIINNQGLFHWTVTRSFNKDTVMQGSRHSLAMSTLSAPPIYGSQVPSFVDLDMFLNATAFAGFYYNGSWYEMQSPTQSQHILLAPAGFEIMQNHSARLLSGSGPRPASMFSYMKPQQDGTASVVALGMSVSDRRSGMPIRCKTGDVHEFSVSFQLLPDTPSADAPTGVRGSPYGNFTLSLPAALQTTSDTLQLFARVQNLFAGWMFGNNPASTPVLQELAFFGWIDSLFDVGASSHKALQKQLWFMSQGAVNASGYVRPRWMSSGFYDVGWGPLIDQVPNFILAVHSIAITSGDRAWLEQIEPTLDRVMGYLLQRGLNATRSPHLPFGVFVSIADGIADGLHHTSNWFDIIEFGHGDAYVGMYALGAIKAMIDIKNYLNKSTETVIYERLLEQCKAAYNQAYWRDDLGRYLDWIDVQGNAREYFYTDHNHLAVIFGIADKKQTTAILKGVLEGYHRLYNAYHLTAQDIWATPCNFWPILNPNDTVTSSGQFGKFPSYENGGAFFHSSGLEIAAWGLAGHADIAWNTTLRFLLHGFDVDRAWAQQLFWNTHSFIGWDPLNNSLMVLWGFVRGVLGIEPTLTRGIQIHNHPLPAVLEGSRYSFSYLGLRHSVCVRQRFVVPC
eukprot:TRINITY_DN1331_c1_g1_i4.p1 TRINITY_DN1331_c1_g1~~TRINITY_DN1331_c1_g1_i4.p1  ORF type:complete len:794 (-),score=74.73 TRINITY_DN1331_c1_g1_i4:120-2501(-)